MPYPLRPATDADIPALRELIPLAARALSVGYYTDRQTESMIRHAIGVDSQLVADGTYYVARRRRADRGLRRLEQTRHALRRRPGEGEADDPLLDPADRTPARIRAFFVHPDFARRGIGRRLIETCEAAAREAGFTPHGAGGDTAR